jgi:GTP-binding nuclear protein Ran
MPEWNFKIVLLGDVGVGKTTLLHRYLAGCRREYLQGVGIIHPITFKTNYGTVTFQCWDTTGRDPITEAFYAGASGCILVFDLTSLSSYEHIEGWHRSIKRVALVPTVLYGGKSDLVRDRAVGDITYHREHKLVYYECTDRTFLYLARTLTGHQDIALSRA